MAADGAAGGTGSGGDRRGERVPEAWLVAIKDGGEPLSDFDRLTLHQAVTIVALELLRGRVAGDTERRLAGDVLAALVGGELTGAELARRLEPFGLSERVAAIVVPWEGGAAAVGAPREGGAEPASRTRWRRRCARRRRPGLVASDGRADLRARARGRTEDELFALAGRVAERLANGRAPAELGVGRPVAGRRRPPQLPRGPVRRRGAGARARTDRRTTGRRATAPVPSPTRVATYKDLGSFQLLLSLQEDEALRLFCDSILGPIEASEGHYGGELMRSLEAFIEENGQWERAARRLYCHRHTLRYRIRRVEELTGRNLCTARDRIEFWLALRGRELVA